MIPRVLIAAQSSGSGKTTVTCGILQALVNRGLKVSSFKCGPDYIDPMFHRKTIGSNSTNLDPFFADDNLLRFLFARNAEGSDISVIEGVMGFYDGSELNTSKNSSCDVSLKLSSPVILIINASGSSISSLATLKGFLGFERNLIKGVIFNRMSRAVFETLKPKAEEMGIKVIGYIPKLKRTLESRHLGLVLPSEIDDIRGMLNELAETFEETLDLDSFVDIAYSACDMDHSEPDLPDPVGKVKVAVADDEAFCFMYRDNLELLERLGAEIVRFSPIHDTAVPKADAMILYGGYPELYAKELSSNSDMRASVRSNILNGMPCLAECGGFMYLHRRMESEDGPMYEMCGIIDADTKRTEGLRRFGYVTLHRKDGGIMKGHEFHHWDSDSCGCDWTAENVSGKKYGCMHDNGTLIAGYPHLYYYSDPEFIVSFLRKAKERSLQGYDHLDNEQ